MITLVEGWQYPIKSAGGFRSPSIRFTERGATHDRKIMLVKPDGTYLSQRAKGMERMACLRTSPMKDHTVYVSWEAEGAERVNTAFELPIAVTPAENGDDRTMTADIRGSSCLGIQLGRDRDPLLSGWFGGDVSCNYISGWFSGLLRTKCHVLVSHPACPRIMKPNASGRRPPIGFLDGAHALVISRASLEGLNRRLSGDGVQVEMNCFRPNFVVEGCEEGEEDTWKLIKIGDVVFFGTHLCQRCSVPMVDQSTGERRKKGEPLRTLKSYRRSGKTPTFGMNFIALNDGEVHEGDEVQILEEWKEQPPTALPLE